MRPNILNRSKWEDLRKTFLIVLFVWISMFPQPIQGKYRLATNIFLISVFACLFMEKRSRRFKLSNYPLWVFLAAISINIFFAQQRRIALATYWDLAIPMFCIYYLISESLSSKKSFELLIKIICACSILVSMGGIFESVFRYNPLYEHFIENPFYLKYITGFVRPMSTQFNPVVLGSYLLATLPFNFLLFKTSRSFLKFSGAAGIVLNLVVIILTLSRGVFLGLISAIIFYLIFLKKYRTLLVFFIILVLLIVFCAYLSYPLNRFGKGLIISENRGIFSQYRFTRLAMSWHIIKEHPLAGLGFQHFRIRFYEYFPYNYKVPFEIMIPDSMYLAFLAETGIIGTLGFFMFICMLFRKWIKKFTEASGHKKQILLVPMLGLIALLVNMGAYELFYWANPYIFFCIICGFIQGAIENV